MGYVFRLKKLADLNLQQEKKLKIELSKQINRLRDAVGLLNSYVEKERGIVSYLEKTEEESKGTGYLRAIEYQYLHQALQGVREDIMAQYNVVKKIQADADNIRQELIKASQDVKILDKLDRKCYKEYMNSLIKLEQENIEQFICNRYNIKKVI